MPETENTNEPAVTEDALEASLDALLKAAGADDTLDQLQKGGQVYSGHYDERGKVGGGGASYSDAGGLDNMMIGKLVAGGMDGKAATALVGEMFGMLTESGLLGHQKGDEDEDEDEDDEEMAGYARGYAAAMRKMGKSHGGDDDDEGDEALAKSHREQFLEDSDIEDGVDASPFMDQLVSRTTGSLDKIVKSMNKAEKKQNNFNTTMARAVVQQGLLIKSQAHVIKELANRLGIVEKQPAAAPKGATSIPQAAALSKGMPGEAGNGNAPEALNKSQMAKVISYLRFEKGMEDINGERTGDAACKAEAGGIVSASMADYVQKYIATHPNERDAALSYA